MPFTLAHPVLVIPLRRRADLTALVVGSLVPDLGHFIGLDLGREYTHGPLVWPLFCVPAGLLLYLLFTRLLRGPLLSLAPAGLAARLPESPPVAGHWYRRPVLLGLLLGAASHIAFDAVTTVPYDQPWTAALMAPRASIAGIAINIQDLLRHGSALLGMSLLAVWGRRWWRATPLLPATPIPRLRPALRLTLLLAATLMVIASALLGALAEDGHSLRHLLGNTVRAALPLGSAALLVYALVWQVWRRLLPMTPPPGAD